MQALIIINDQAGALSSEVLAQALQEALQHKPESVRENVTIEISHSREHMQNMIQQYQGQLDRVIAAGGDGTIIEIISAMLPYPHLMLGILPFGTGNRLAANLGIPTTLRDALDTALYGIPHRIDIGRINNRYFALMAGAGLDAEIMGGVTRMEKRTFGLFAYFIKGFRHLFRTPYAVFDIEADGHTIHTRGFGVVIANAGNLLGHYFTLTPGAQPDDGLLDICIFSSNKRTDYWNILVQVLSRQTRGIQPEGVKHLRAKNIRIQSRPKLKAQADGDLIGTTPIEVEAIPSAIAVLIPRLKKNPLTDSLQHITDHVRLLIRDLFRRST
jgi:YegS/Rv2252/BmrU family lipid kinase